tara:strand:- start:264 stop:815 length:552 start_codon:yes stop_codon:yes gene_type:complete
MTLRIEKEAFNIREKINELDGVTPYHKMPPGSVIQVQQGVLTSQTESTAGTGVRVTLGLEVAITPHFPSSKILVTMDGLSMRVRAASTSYFLMIQRRFGNSGDWVDHWVFAEYAGGGTTTGGLYNREHFPGTSYLDSAGTTQEISYRLQGEKLQGANIAFHHNASGSRGARNYCTLTAMEVKQ